MKYITVPKANEEDIIKQFKDYMAKHKSNTGKINFSYDYAKQVECYVFIKDKPDVALRKLYYFKNSIWTLNEITDYNYREYVPVKCTFVKIKDIADYTNKTEFRIQQYM